MSIPTLLLGLGGIGSRIVDRVYGKIPEERREEEVIGVHAFDTNVNDIKQLEHLEDHVTQTSAPMRVKDYLKIADPIVEDWFPRHRPDGNQNDEILNMTLTNGAGQIRPVSRLAYRASMEDGDLRDFKSNLRDLLRAQGDPFDADLRVMIVCSLAGGTGAGMFLQTALYLRDYLRNEIGAKSFLLRGAFVLPDILLKNRVLPLGGMQEENVKANAYACMKELDAITKGQEVELEYKPNQVTIDGTPDLAVGKDDPFKFAFLYGYEKEDGANLGSFESYERQVVETIYLQLFSPVKKAQFSDEDNQIAKLIKSKGGAQYAAAGMATLEYPYEDILEYCAIQWASSGLSQQWLRLDEEYKQELKEFKLKKAGGAHLPKPELEERYVKLLEMHATEENPAPFFRQVYESAHKQDENGRPTTPKAKAFVEALVQHIEEVAENYDDVSEIRDNTKKQLEENREDLDDRDNVVTTISDIEEALGQLEREVKTFIRENKTVLSNQAVTRDRHEDGKTGGQDYRLNTWILSEDGSPLHPVAVRYFLYQVKLELDERLSSLGSRCDRLKDLIDSYEEKYNKRNTERVETPIERARAAMKQGLLGRLFDNELGSFAEVYASNARKHRRNLVAYQKTRIKEQVLEDVREDVEDFLDQWESYFRNLRAVKRRLDERIQRSATKHEEIGDPSRIFVLATEEDKKTFWNELRSDLASNVLLSDDIAEEIYVDQYDIHVSDKKGKKRAVQQFEDTVVQWCRQKLREEDLLDLDIIQALREEARRRDIDGNDHVEDKKDYISNLACPLLKPRDTNDDAEPQKYWAAHPRAVSAVKGAASKGSLSQGLAEEWFGEDLIRDEAFSPYELLCYENLFGVEAGDLPNFSAGDELNDPGPYYEAYRKRLQELTGEAEPVVTPHLDSRWHIPVHLEDTINPEEAEEAKRRVDQAFVRGLVYGFFQETIVDTVPTWQFNGPEGPSAIRIQGSPCPSEPHGLHEGLQYNPSAVNRVMERSLEMQTEDKTEYPMNHPPNIAHHRFHGGCLEVPGADGNHNILDMIFRFSVEAPGQPDIIEKSNTVLDHALDDIKEYYEFVYGDHQKNLATDRAANFIDKLREESEVYQNADSKGTRQDWEAIIDSKVDTFRKTA